MNRKLIEYLPSFYKEIKEIKEILRSLDISLQEFYNAFNEVEKNQYIMTSDVDTIIRWESMLGLEHVGELDERRQRIIDWISNIVPITERTIRQEIDVILEGGVHDVIIDPVLLYMSVAFQNLLDTETIINEDGEPEEVLVDNKGFLKKLQALAPKIPQNLLYKLTSTFPDDDMAKGSIYVGGAVCIHIFTSSRTA